MDSPPETILLAVTGMSPAILTETVWALAHEPEPILPHRVMVVTTTSGREHLGALFDPVPGLGGVSPWNALRQALADVGHDLKGRLRFGLTPDDIRVFTMADPHTGRSEELCDLRSPADNDAAADFLLETVRGLVENPDTQLVASLAGGRKTMGALLYACLTLIGRESDRLTHVLVNEPFETLRGFWFPGQPGGPIAVARNEEASCLDPALAKVQLADVPFVPLRNLFRRELGQPAGSFRRLLETCRANLRINAGESLKLEIHTARTESVINGRPLTLAPREHLVLLFFAQRAKRGEIILGSYDEALSDLENFRKSVCASAPVDDWSDWRSSASLGRKFDDRAITRILSDIRAKAKQAGGDAAFLADVLPAKGRCSLDIPGPLIFIK